MTWARCLLGALTLVGLVPVAALPQDRQGRDTPGEWVVTHYKPFGLWDSICDERTTGDLLEERCYLRYVEVFSPRPNFAAQFIFITPAGSSEIVEFGLERGTRFSDGGFRIEADDRTVWRNDRRSCLRGRDCTFEGPEAAALLGAMAGATRFIFDFTDRHGTPQVLNWDLTQFGAALDDYRAAADARGLTSAATPPDD
ncbi:MAG: hypothetical protein AAF667_09870 [Pseudomonadota bacterium]